MEAIMILLFFFIALVVVFFVSAVTGVAVALVVCGIHMRVANENNKVDYYSNYISRINIELLKTYDLK